jgi:hypothetical protein|mmetsp:Transcript_88106/g.139222  ORF Transcript_88106/g.139222 Transcript_88106/m.139222 type:complete len:272 (+) Transcript_88106:76-891(+)|eukprot:CAMPEP_0169114298 /NCGR_PEP_ID=MMETSP1015-20121227/28669_1 /TAXON_ID=342587 /ORGANISM="Karlodinium micrum, Strain CCMP2283" /LENGTH=271 /DNA_ID=CAMNT_0009176543 /DNA_START=75 /DNA_END=890 /DNA_ORIENTATION=-
MFDAQTKESKSAANSHITIIYGIFLALAFLVYHLLAEGEFSSLLTVSAIMQCLAFALLGWQVVMGSITGISAQALALDAVSLCFRLSCTTWLNGYLPVDASGDYAYQIVDTASLVMVLWLAQRIFSAGRDMEDAFPVGRTVLGALVLASILHPDLNDRPVFDTLWMAGLFLSCISVLPQLWLIVRSNSPVAPMTSHFIAVMALARMISGLYMFYAHEEYFPEKPYIAGFNHCGWAVLGAHFVHLLLLADFAYYYAKTVTTCGLNSPLELPL